MNWIERTVGPGDCRRRAERGVLRPRGGRGLSGTGGKTPSGASCLQYPGARGGPGRGGGGRPPARRRRDPGPLAGVPVAVKDNICTRGVPTTCSSRILESFVPPYDATVVERLEAAGASSSARPTWTSSPWARPRRTPAFGPTRNPWDPGRVPGGSSGGSAAAVAAGLAPLALGSDTGGSIRQPAAFCGVVGLKPTYGAVSRYGLVAFASSLDQIGPLARDVPGRGVAAVGHRRPRRPRLDLGPARRTRIIAAETGRGIRRACAWAFRANTSARAGRRGRGRRSCAAVEALRGPGRRGRARSPCRTTEYALAAYYLIAPAEASSNLARYDGVRYGLRVEGEDTVGDVQGHPGRGFGPEVKRRIMIGHTCSRPGTTTPTTSGRSRCGR